MTDKGCQGNRRRLEGMCVVVRMKKKDTVSDMGCLKKTLKIVKSPPSEIFEKPSLELPVVTMNGHIPRSNINKGGLYNGFFSSDRSNYDKSDASQDEDEDDDDDFFTKEESSDDTDRKEKSYRRQPKNSALARQNRISRKRLSVEEKLIEDNKSYYRVEVLNSKLRSSEYFVNQKQLESRVNDEIENDSCSDEGECSREAQQPLSKNAEKSKEPVVVRFKKVRKSQLSVLSDEAESFMFGDSARREAKKIEYTSPDESSDSADSETSSSEEEELPKIKKMVPDSDEDGSPFTKDMDSDSLSSPPTLTCDHDSVSESEEDITEDCADTNITLNSITFSFENPPKKEPWIETYKRQDDGKNEYHYPYHHDYPKVLLPFEYPVAERLKLLSGKRVQGFGRRRGRRKIDDGRARKSPRCHASTLAVMSNFLRRPLRECSKSSDFSYEEESRSSLPDTVETSSSTSEYRLNSFMSNSNSLPIDPNGDVFAAAIARVACGETSTLQVSPGPCLAVNPALMDNPRGMDIYLQPGLTVPLEAIINQYNSDTSWMEYMDYSSSCHEQASEIVTCYEPQSTEVNDKTYIKSEPYHWPEIPLRRRRKRMKKQEESRPVVPPVLIKCEPCEIKLEPMSAKILQHFGVKDEPVLIKEESISVGNERRFHSVTELAPTSDPPPPIVKRGRGRPRKYPLPTEYQSPSSGFATSSPQLPPNNSCNNKSTIPRFSFIQRSFINQIV
ncbi:uncharacterized protein [Halyomorpha halys]|uniref:uncharacterized protein isoform X2 n=1 Tax=Halyomorpha halys TaxID=286706 RepID=UPI0006D4F098|nr:uncharacterized protein LOC106681693 isoform X2 [Halyomorpha halys]